MKKEISKIDRIQKQIAELQAELDYMKNSKFSRGLSEHDYKMYEDYKERLRDKQLSLTSAIEEQKLTA